MLMIQGHKNEEFYPQAEVPPVFIEDIMLMEHDLRAGRRHVARTA
jgi:hypothetical protein